MPIFNKTILQQSGFRGEIQQDLAHRIMYATDASIYEEQPMAVVFPKDTQDIRRLVCYCADQQLPIIPRAAGTSIAGQCVGNGVVMDVSRHMNQILHFNPAEAEVTVQPGVVRDELNLFLQPHGLWFAPNTSTSNRATIGGMIGNNSAGSTSMKYGVSRDKIIALQMINAHAELLEIKPIDSTIFENILLDNTHKMHHILTEIDALMSDASLQDAIAKDFPKPSIHRRNTGYALDELCKFERFGGAEKELNLAKLLCGSEGTLGIFTSLTLRLEPLPAAKHTLVAPYFKSLRQALEATAALTTFDLETCELMDDVIMSCAARHPKAELYQPYFQADTKAILLLELRACDQADLSEKVHKVQAVLQAFEPIQILQIQAPKDQLLWEIRKNGLGLLSNIRGDETAIACIEDTAVDVQDLAQYIDAFESLILSHDQQAVYYAHAGAGELHLRPVLNLKTAVGRKMLEQICLESALLVKKFNGSLSGEHGDGRVRAPFISQMYGTEVMQALVQVKTIFDPLGLFNPHKIVHPKGLTEDLRYSMDQAPSSTKAWYRDPQGDDLLQQTERCNGSADCRKSAAMGPGMCPTFQASHEEQHTTRARANLLRNVFRSADFKLQQSTEMLESIQTCLSCKACASECPSEVDLSKLKAEFLAQYYQHHKRPLRDYMFAFSEKIGKSGVVRYLSEVGAFVLGSKFVRSAFGLSKNRALPLPASRKFYASKKVNANQKSVYLWIDEFAQQFDHEVTIATIDVLEALNYQVHIIQDLSSGRSYLSKAFLSQAKSRAEKVVATLASLSLGELPIIGLEPSAVLSLRDEYPALIDAQALDALSTINQRLFLFEEFLAHELRSGTWSPELFKNEMPITAHYHIHCHQRANSNWEEALFMLSSIPQVNLHHIHSGCCGMAGSFGYEAEHEALSFQVAETHLFPYIRAQDEADVILASGLSCRHQIKDGLERKSLHPAQFLLTRLKT